MPLTCNYLGSGAGFEPSLRAAGAAAENRLGCPLQIEGNRHEPGSGLRRGGWSFAITGDRRGTLPTATSALERTFNCGQAFAMVCQDLIRSIATPPRSSRASRPAWVTGIQGCQVHGSGFAIPRQRPRSHLILKLSPSAPRGYVFAADRAAAAPGPGDCARLKQRVMGISVAMLAPAIAADPADHNEAMNVQDSDGDHAAGQGMLRSSAGRP